MATMTAYFTTRQEQAEFASHLQRKLFLSEELAVALSKELIDRFLPIKRYLKDFEDATICSPSPLIDAAWHELILFTKLYAKICGKTFIHHNPIGELDTIQVKAARYVKTLKAYEDLFGTQPSDEDIWPRIYPGCESEDDGNIHNPSGQVQEEQHGSSSPPVATSSGRKRKEATPAAATARRRSQRNREKPNRAESYQIIVKTFAANKPPYNIQVESTTTIEEIKVRLHDISGIPSDQQRLLYGGNGIVDERTVADYGIEPFDVIHCMLEQSGC